jgi:hypothetical protein
MGMAKLNVWVSGLDEPCTVDSRTWYVTIYGCDGKVLQWCGRTYGVIPARCGHLEVEVPPGTYYLKAVWSYWVEAGGLVYHGNHFTDAAIVQACCEHTTCVKLFTPQVHRCGIIFIRAIQDLVHQKAVDPALARTAMDAVQKLLEQVPRPIKGFELDHIDELDKLAQAAEKEAGKAE